MASKGFKKVSTERDEMKIRRNRKIRRLLKAGVSTHAVSKKINISYSRAKKTLC